MLGETVLVAANDFGVTPRKGPGSPEPGLSHFRQWR